MKPPPSLQSLKERLAGFGKRDASDASAAGRLADGIAKAGELRARIKARVDQLSRDGADLGAVLNAKVEELLKPRPVEPPRSQTKSPPPTDAEYDPFSHVPEATPIHASSAPSTADAGSDRGKDPSIVTRTLGHVGLTAVHARLGALAKGRKKAPARLSPSDQPAAPPIQRIDWDMPPITPPAAAQTAQNAFAEQAPTIPSPFVRPARSVTQEATRRRRAGGRRRLAGLFGMLLTAVVTAALVHIATTLAIPTLSTWFGKGTAYDRLRFKLQPNAMKQLPVEVSTAQPLLPFLTPDMHYAFCRYDLSTMSIAVSVTLPDVGWSLALYTPQGDNFYAAPGIEGRATDLSFVIVPSSDRLLILPGVRRADVDATQVTSPTREGLVVVRAPNKGRAFEASTKAALARANCQPVSRR